MKGGCGQGVGDGFREVRTRGMGTHVPTKPRDVVELRVRGVDDGFRKVRKRGMGTHVPTKPRDVVDFAYVTWHASSFLTTPTSPISRRHRRVYEKYVRRWPRTAGPPAQGLLLFAPAAWEYVVNS